MECFQFPEAFHLPEFPLRIEQPGRGPAQRLIAAPPAFHVPRHSLDGGKA